jgi:hypothetical protein
MRVAISSTELAASPLLDLIASISSSNKSAKSVIEEPAASVANPMFW